MNNLPHIHRFDQEFSAFEFLQLNLCRLRSVQHPDQFENLYSSPEIGIFHSFQKVIQFITLFGFENLLAFPIISKVIIFIVPLCWYIPNCVTNIFFVRTIMCIFIFVICTVRYIFSFLFIMYIIFMNLCFIKIPMIFISF